MTGRNVIYGALVTFLVVAAVMAARLPIGNCQAFKYDAKGKRDPFISLVRSAKAMYDGLESVEAVEDLRLEGIAQGGAGKMIAIINSKMVKDGDMFGALKIKRIMKTSVAVSISGTEYTLNLSDGGGAKGEKKY